MKTKCLIIDDEPLARELIRNHIGKLENFEIVAECTDAMKALNVLREKTIDLMFMDIQMPQITGLEFLKTLRNSPKVIITTAYREYAIDGFELDVVDYLLKPITFERFLKAINKFYLLNQDDSPHVSLNRVDYLQEEPYLYVKENKKILKVFLSDIIYIEGLSEYVQIHTEKRKIVTKTSMVQMEDKLPSESFVRIHKSYIVALSKVEAFTANTIEVVQKELPIGRSFKSAVLNALNFVGNINGG